MTPLIPSHDAVQKQACYSCQALSPRGQATCGMCGHYVPDNGAGCSGTCVRQECADGMVKSYRVRTTCAHAACDSIYPHAIGW
jgi:hypothetical protein